MAGRGRGRGSGGSGRGGGPFQTGSSFMGGFTYSDIARASEAEMSKTLFPKQSLPDWQEPTTKELRSQRYYRAYLRGLRFSAYHVAIPETRNNSMVKYSDRYEEPVEVLPSLSDAEQKQRLNPAFFPTAIWQAFFEKQAKQPRKKEKKKYVNNVQQTFATVDAQTAERRAGKDGEGQNSADEQEEADVDEFDDDEENPDYDCNYFDAGDDDDDGGGDDGAEATFD